MRIPSFMFGGGERTMRVPAGGPCRSETRLPSDGPVTTATLRTVSSGCTAKTALVSPLSTTASGWIAGVGAAFCAASSSSRARNVTFAPMSGSTSRGSSTNATFTVTVALARSTRGRTSATLPRYLRSGNASSAISAGVPSASLATCDSETSASTCSVLKSAMEAMPPLPAFPALVKPKTISPMSVSFCVMRPANGART